MEVTITHVEDESVDELSDSVLPLTIGEETSNLRKLRPADLAQAESYMRGKAMSFLLEAFRFTPTLESVQGPALATIASKSYTLTDLTTGQESRLYLLWLSLKRGGSDKTWEWVQGNIRTNLLREMEDVMMWISRLEMATPEPGADPTTPGSKTPQ